MATVRIGESALVEEMAKIRQRPHATTVIHATLENVRILVVEDDASIAEPLASGLTREGFDVETVASGADALAELLCPVWNGGGLLEVCPDSV